MAKLAIDRASIVFGKKNREIFIPNREIGRFSLFYQKSGDLPKNRETWKLCIVQTICVQQPEESIMYFDIGISF